MGDTESLNMWGYVGICGDVGIEAPISKQTETDRREKKKNKYMLSVMALGFFLPTYMSQGYFSGHLSGPLNY